MLKSSLAEIRDFYSKRLSIALVIAVVSFLLGRTVVLGVVSPFAPAMYAGLKVARVPGSSLFAAVSLLGALTTKDTRVALNQAIVMLVTAVVLDPPFLRVKRARPVVAYALVATLGFAARAIGESIDGLDAGGFVIAAIEGVSLFFLSALLSKAAASLGEGDRSAYSKQALIAAVVLSLGGLPDMSSAALNLKVLFASVSVLIGGYLTGPGGGAVAGVAGGLITTLTSEVSRPLRIIDYLAVSGSLAGIGGWFGRVEAVAGHLAAGLAMSFFQPSADDVRARLIEQMLASLVFLALPRPLERALKDAMGKTTVHRKESGRDPGITVTVLASIFNHVAQLFLRASSSNGADNWAQEALLAVVDRVCDECSNRTHCWEDSFGDTFDAMCSLVRSLGLTGRVREGDVPQPLSDRCAKLAEVVAELNHEKQLHGLRLAETRFYNETRESLAGQYASLARILESMKNSGERSPKKPQLAARIGSVVMPGHEGEEPGDTWMAFSLDPARMFVGLADGMGKGGTAARQSKDALSLLRLLLECGVDYETAISFLNSTLYLAFRPESFVAMDCVLLDLSSERAYFHKMGAAPSFIRRADGNVLVVKGSVPPAGALASLPWTHTTERLEEGDILLLVSDGLFRSCPVPERAEQWLVSYLKRLKSSNPDSLVRSLLQRGIRRQGGNPEDDITVVAVRIEKASVPAEEGQHG